MTGTPSQGQLPLPRGAVERKPEAKSQPKEHKPHEAPDGGRRCETTSSPKVIEYRKA
jgi:hypothetical protein